MDLRQIDNIIAIEQEKSISKAAQKLFLTQSALNQQLLRLEKELGTQLFERKKSYVDPDAPIAYFTVPPRYTWMRIIAYLKGSYLTKPEKYFMSLAINYVKGTLEN